jgi:hypothetical protein
MLDRLRRIGVEERHGRNDKPEVAARASRDSLEVMEGLVSIVAISSWLKRIIRH